MQAAPQACSPQVEKAVATAKARAALRGVALHVTEDDHCDPLYVAVQGSMTRHMTSLDEVERFLKLIGAPAA
jgi:hypothetical protein